MSDVAAAIAVFACIFVAWEGAKAWLRYIARHADPRFVHPSKRWMADPQTVEPEETLSDRVGDLEAWRSSLTEMGPLELSDDVKRLQIRVEGLSDDFVELQTRMEEKPDA